MNNENNVILAILKLSRAMRRCAPPPSGIPGSVDRGPQVPEDCGPDAENRMPGPGGPMPEHGSRRPERGGRGAEKNPNGCAPAVGRLLACVAENPRVSSRDLCEILDLRPSSLSEMLARAESEGWITRTVDEEDRRIQRIDLSPKGRTYIGEMEKAREEDLNRKTACFTEEEKAQFCALCNRLSDHLESLASDIPSRRLKEDQPRRRPFPPEGRIRC